MAVSLTVGKVDAGVTVLLTPDKRLIEFPSILLPPNISSGSVVDITVAQNSAKEVADELDFGALQECILMQECILTTFGASEPAAPVLRCRNATQTSVVLEWDPIKLATADLISLSLYRNGQKASNIPRPRQMHSTKISGLAVDTEYAFHLVLKTTAGTRLREKVAVRTHKMTDLSGITITPGVLPTAARERLAQAVERIGAKIADGVHIDTTHFVTTEGRGAAWEKAVENNIPVIRPQWVEACEKNGRILGVTKFYLDAMRPGPPSEDHSPPPPVPAKDEPPRQLDSPGGQGDKTEADDGDDSGSREQRETEPGQEVTNPPPDERKMQVEDREELKVVLRPREDELATDSEAKGEEDGGHGHGKPVATPDASSFQEVEL